MKVLLVDDHQIVRNGLRRLIDLVKRSEYFDAETDEQGFHLFNQIEPDLVVLDLRLGHETSGMTLLKRIREIDRTVKVIVLSMKSETHYVSAAIEQGADAFVTKAGPSEEFLDAVSRVLKGEKYFANDVNDGFGHLTSLEPLTAREQEIFDLLGNGDSLSKIAAKKGVAYKSVANMCAVICLKMRVNRTAQLVRLAIEAAHQKKYDDLS